MISVSKIVASALYETLNKCGVSGEQSLRLIKDKDVFSLQLDRPQKTDRVIRYEGTIIILINKQLENELGDRRIDIEELAESRCLVIRSLKDNKLPNKADISTKRTVNKKMRQGGLIMKRDQVIDIIKQVHIGYLATVCTDNTPRVRPLSINTVYDGDLYFFTFNNTRKVEELNANPRVEVVWTNMDNLYQVRIRGQAETVEDRTILQQFKADNPKATQMLPPGTEHLFRLYRIKPDQVEVAEGLVPYKEVIWNC